MSTTKDLQTQLDYIQFSSEHIHGYSKGVQKLFQLAVSYIFDAEQAFADGKKICWARGLWEAPLVYACDTIPVSFTEVGRLGSYNAITIAEDYFQMPREACSMVKATVGEWFLRKNKINRILGFSVDCEPYNVALELMSKAGYDVHYIDTIYLPPRYTDEQFEQLLHYFIDQIYGAAEWLSGKPLDETRLATEIKRRNEILRKLRKIMQLRIAHPHYIRSLPTMFLIMGSGHYFGKPEAYAEVLDLLVDELENAAAPSEQINVIPLVWAGGRGQEFGVYQAIDDAGGAILGWVIPTPFARDYPEDVPPVESLARYVLNGQSAGATIYNRRVVEEQVKKVNARGVIQYGYVGCSFSGIAREMTRQYLRKRDVPSISLEGSFQVGPPSGQILTRVKAFVEMLSTDDSKNGKTSRIS